MSDKALQPPTPSERAIGATLGSITSSGENLIQNPMSSGPLLASVAVSARGSNQQNMNLHVQPGGHYTTYLPSSRRSTQTRPHVYGPTPTPNYLAHRGVGSQASNTTAGANSNHNFPLRYPFVPNRGETLPHYLTTSSGPDSRVYNPNLASHGQNPQTNSSSDPAGSVSSPWNQTVYPGPSQNLHATSPRIGSTGSLQYTSPPAAPGFQAVSSRPIPNSNLNISVPNVSSPAVRADVPVSDFMIRTRVRNVGDLSVTPIANPLMPPNYILPTHAQPRRNLMQINARNTASQTTAPSNHTPNNFTPTNYNSTHNTVVPSATPLAPPPTAAVATRRRSRKTRIHVAAPSNQDRSSTASTTHSNRKPPAKPKTSKNKKIPPTENKQPCSICLEIPTKTDEASINGCSHIFCFGCIEKWADRENTCPLCKMRFTKIDRVTKKRKKDAPRTKNTKKVKNRDQRADIGAGNPLHGLFASMDGVVPQAIAQLIIGPVHNRFMTITTGNRSPTRANIHNNSRITIQNRLLSHSSRSTNTRSTRSSFLDAPYPLESLAWIATASGTGPRRSARLENITSSTRHRSESSLRGASRNNALSPVHEHADSLFPINPIDQINPRVRSIIFDHPDMRNNHFSTFGITSEDEDSQPDIGSLVSHLNQTTSENQVNVENQQSFLDPDFFLRHSQPINSNNDLQQNHVGRSYALNIDGGDTAANALEIQDSDDEVEIADGSDAEVEVLVE